MVMVLIAFGIGAAVLAINGAGAQEGESERPGERFIAETAERLGITPEELTAAMTEAQFEIIEDKVVEGALTEEQATKLKERIEEYGPLSVIGLKHRVGHRAICLGARLVVVSAAEVLGKEPAEVAEAVKSGESLAEQAEAQGVSVDDFTAALLDAVKAKLDEKVAEGKITQEQADRALAAIEEHIDRVVQFGGAGEGGPCDRPRGDDRPLRRQQAETSAAQ
jgi:lipoate-protein ligase A